MDSISIKTSVDLIRDLRYGRLQWPLHIGQAAMLLSGNSYGRSFRYWLMEMKHALATGNLVAAGTVQVRYCEMGNLQGISDPPFVDSPLIEKEPLQGFLRAYLADPTAPLHPLVKARLCASAAAPAPAPTLPRPAPAAQLVDPQARSEGDSKATVEHEMRSRKGKELADLQHAAKNQWYADQEELAESRWEAGCSLRHDQIADDLMETAPPELKISRDTLMARLKEVLNKIGKPELIRGIKKN